MNRIYNFDILGKNKDMKSKDIQEDKNYKTKSMGNPIGKSIGKTIGKTKSKTKGKTKGKKFVKLLNTSASTSASASTNTNTSKTYIANLVNLYYDNDNISNMFLKTKNTKQHIFPEHNRVIVIGDIHGDFDVAIKCLIIAKCINNIKIPDNKNVSSMDNFFKQLEWIGNDTYIVQLGDQIDRVRPQNWDNNEITKDEAYKDEGSTLEIFYLFYLLDNIAKQKGGRVFSIIGNHEIMNVEGDFRFVSLKEFKSFKEHLETVYHKNSKYPYHSRTLKHNSYKMENDAKSAKFAKFAKSDHSMINVSNDYSKLPDGFRERLYAFSPTGLCSNMMGSNSYTILQIGKWLFCHGSPVLNTFNTYNIESINNYVSMYLLGIENNEKQIIKHYHSITQTGQKSVLWNRAFGDIEINDKKEDILSTQLDTILEAYNNKNRKEQKEIEDRTGKTHMEGKGEKSNSNNITVNYIAVGHTIQDTSKHGINSICNGRVWRCDVAMSKAFGSKKNNRESSHRRPQVLEILNGINTNILI